MNKSENTIGLNKVESQNMIDKLNSLLANYQVFHQNLRGFHWNISGPSFFELHAKFEELYTSANLAADEIAERILTLEGHPLHTFSDYLELSSVKPAKDLKTAKETVGITISNMTTLIELEREILNIAGKVNDEGTDALMSDYIRAQEKTVWMLRAYNS